MDKVFTLAEAIARFVKNGDRLAIGGFTTSRKPMAAVHEIIRQGMGEFIGEGGPAGGDWDLLIGMKRVRAYINCYTANPRFSNISRRFRAAIESGELLFEDYSQDAAMMMFHAAALGLPYVPTRYMFGSGMEDEWGISEEQRKTISKLPDKKFIIQENPYQPDEKLVLLPTPQIDTAIIHVQIASEDGTCRIFADEYHDVDIALAAKHTIVTCEELVSNEEIRKSPKENSLPGFVIDAVVHAPYGAHPMQCAGYYDYDKAYLRTYDEAGKTDESFQAFVAEWVYGTKDHESYLNKLGTSRVVRLNVERGLGYVPREKS